MDIKVIIATHKKYQIPVSNIYMPIQVGAEGKENIGFTRDDTGDNISNKNPYFCELTGLYWAWKNLDTDYLGLVHYRRYFTISNNIPKSEDEKFKIVLNREELEKELQNTDLILPKKRNYFIETIYSHYKHTLYIEPLDETRKIIEEKYPEYLKEFDRLKTRRSSHMFNMFIGKKTIIDEYCKWIFDILFELEKRVDKDIYDSFHARFFGRISERLFDVWINTNKIPYKEMKIIDMQNINWFNKIKSFLSAKLLGKKYKASF